MIYNRNPINSTMFHEGSEERLRRWFKGLTPAQRLKVAEEIEQFRRRARFVDD